MLRYFFKIIVGFVITLWIELTMMWWVGLMSAMIELRFWCRFVRLGQGKVREPYCSKQWSSRDTLKQLMTEFDVPSFGNLN